VVLFGFVSGLLSTPLFPYWCAVGCAVAALLAGSVRPNGNVLRNAVRFTFAVALGLAVAAHAASVRSRENATRFDGTRFVTVEAPLNRGWTARNTLHLDRFAANGIAIAQPLTIYARFAPPDIGMHATIRAHGFLRRSDETGAWSLTLKSPLLMAYSGELHPLDPARWNRALALRIAPLAPKYPVEVAMVNALALGRSEMLSDDVRDSFRHGGTYHLLVFSGLQIALAAAAIAWLLRCLHAPRAADWLLLAFAVLAPLFISAKPSISRASVAIALYAVARILKRPTSLENLWCVAALLRLAVAPADVADVAFQMTYAGAGALLFIAKRRRWLAPLAAELVVVPLTLFHFHQFAWAGAPAMLLLAPVVVVMLIACAVVLAFPTAIVIITPLHAACGYINDLGAHASGFFAAPARLAMIAAAIASLAAIAFLTSTRRAIALAAIALLTGATALAPKHHAAAELTALDVGQGDSLLLRADDHVVLVDGGGRADDPRTGETQLLPLLVDRGVRHIDAVALTHAHPDHCGGVPAVIEQLDVGAVWLSPRRLTGDCAQRVLEACIRTSTPIHLARDGDRLALGPLHATAMLAPTAFRRAKENNSSLVLRVQLQSHRILLTGDIEREAEAELSSRNLRCEILKVAHHGSRSSSSAPLLDAAHARVAVISCGRHNVFGHPHPATLAALAERRIRVWRTDLNGSVTFTFAGRHTRITTEIDTSSARAYSE
jgi:competence protein ComEC